MGILRTDLLNYLGADIVRQSNQGCCVILWKDSADILYEWTRHCDCVIIKGGNFRGERDYDSHKFSMEGLKSEMDGRECVHIFLAPGSVLEAGLRESFQVWPPLSISSLVRGRVQMTSA